MKRRLSEKFKAQRIIPKFTVTRFERSDDREDHCQNTQYPQQEKADYQQTQRQGNRAPDDVGHNRIGDYFAMSIDAGQFGFFPLPDDYGYDKAQKRYDEAEQGG